MVLDVVHQGFDAEFGADLQKMLESTECTLPKPSISKAAGPFFSTVYVVEEIDEERELRCRIRDWVENCEEDIMSRLYFTTLKERNAPNFEGVSTSSAGFAYHKALPPFQHRGSCCGCIKGMISDDVYKEYLERKQVNQTA